MCVLIVFKSFLNAGPVWASFDDRYFNLSDVSKVNGLYLHQFKWTKERLIGALPKNWNVLVGEQKIPKKINALHYTLGGPWFKKHLKSKGAKYWIKYKKENL